MLRLALCALATPAAAQTCLPLPAVIETLSEQWGEAPVGQGLSNGGAIVTGLVEPRDRDMDHHRHPPGRHHLHDRRRDRFRHAGASARAEHLRTDHDHP